MFVNSKNAHKFLLKEFEKWSLISEKIHEYENESSQFQKITLEFKMF